MLLQKFNILYCIFPLETKNHYKIGKKTEADLGF